MKIIFFVLLLSLASCGSDNSSSGSGASSFSNNLGSPVTSNASIIFPGNANPYISAGGRNYQFGQNTSAQAYQALQAMYAGQWPVRPTQTSAGYVFPVRLTAVPSQMYYGPGGGYPQSGTTQVTALDVQSILPR